MYSKITRQLNERERAKLQKQIDGLRGDRKDIPKRFSCAFGCLSPIGIAIYISLRNEAYAGFTGVMMLIVFHAIAASVALDTTVKAKGKAFLQ